MTLGGGLASVQALSTGASAITFNAAGISEGTITRYRLDRRNAENIEAYYNKGEGLHILQRETSQPEAIGNMVELSPVDFNGRPVYAQSLGPIERHSMGLTALALAHSYQ